MESALDKFQFIEISHLLSPKTNPKKPGAQPSDKPKAVLPLRFCVAACFFIQLRFHF